MKVASNAYKITLGKSQENYLFHASFLLGFFLDPEYEEEIFLS
jgi:hypothetical protein